MSTQVETLYRAKNIKSGEYVTGSLINNQYIVTDIDNWKAYSIGYGVSVVMVEIEKSTLAIHFTNSNMTDSEGTRIFASLSSDGNGGDEVTDLSGIGGEPIVFSSLGVRNIGYDFQIADFNRAKVTGIYATDKE